MSQPTVSSHIRDLEDHFGCRLIDRLTREAVPTKAGELLYQYAQRLLALREETETALSEFHGKIKGRLNIGGSTIPGGYLLPEIIANFKKQYPDVNIALKIGHSAKIIQTTVNGKVELGVVGARSTHPDITQQQLFEDELFVVVPINHRWATLKKIAPKKLLAEPFIVREAGSGTRKSMRTSFDAIDLNLDGFNVVAEMGSNQSVINGIKNGLGISILSGIAVTAEAAQKNLALLTIDGLRLKRSFYLSMRRKRTLSPLAGIFVEFLKKTSTLSPAGEKKAAQALRTGGKTI